MQTSITNDKQQEVADRVFFTIAQVGYEKGINVEGFSIDGVTIRPLDGVFQALYEEELKAILAEFNNAILDRYGLNLYD